MSNHTDLTVLDPAELDAVTGGAGLDLNAVRQQAAQYCPQTAAKYANVDSASLTRQKAQRMGDACLAEMGPLKASFARGTIQGAIDHAFPK